MVMDHEEFWPIKERIQELATVAAEKTTKPSGAADHCTGP